MGWSLRSLASSAVANRDAILAEIVRAPASARVRSAKPYELTWPSAVELGSAPRLAVPTSKVLFVALQPRARLTLS